MMRQKRLAARHVLMARLDGMGDPLMTGPAIRALKGAVPGRTVTALASPAGSARAWGAGPQAEGRPLVVLHPEASEPARRTPEEPYATVLRLLEHGLDAACVLTGADGERDPLRRIRPAARSDAAVACAISLAELAGLPQPSDVVVTDNAGPAHLATAVETPVVVLYALTNPPHTPWTAASRVPSADVPCRNCFKSVFPSGHLRCLHDASPRQVADPATELLLDGAALARRALC